MVRSVRLKERVRRMGVGRDRRVRVVEEEIGGVDDARTGGGEA